MEINGKELGMAYTVGAHTEWQSWVVANPEKSLAEAQVESVVIMHKWWCRLNKTPEKQRVTREEILEQPYEIFKEMTTLAEATMKADKHQSIEAESKNQKSAARND